MKKPTRWIAMLLSLVMVLGLLPTVSLANAAEDGLVLHYDFESLANGTIVEDISGNGKAGEVMPRGSGVQTQQVEIYGQQKTAIVIAGGSPSEGHNYVEMPVGVLNDLSSVTISCWVYINRSVSYGRIWDIGSNTTSYMYLLDAGANSGHTGYTTAITGSGWGNEIGPEKGSNLATRTWKLTTVTFNGATNEISLYEDGEKIGTSVAAVNLSRLQGTTQNWIGYGQFKDNLLNGMIADFRIYDYAMTDAEVAALFEIPDDDRVQRDYNSLSLGNTTNLEANLRLPTTGAAGSNIEWTTSDPGVITADGVITRPAAGQPNASATLTARIYYGEAELFKTFNVTVQAMPTDEDRVTYDTNAINLGSLNAVTEDLNLPTVGEKGCSISWTSSEPQYLSETGKVTRPVGEPVTVTLTALVSYGDASKTREFTVTILPVYEKLDAIRAEEVSVTTKVGIAPALPAVVLTTFEDGSKRMVKVTWPTNLSGSSYVTPGTYTVTGQLVDFDVTVPATVTVVEELPTPAAEASLLKLSDVTLDGNDTIYGQNMGRALEYLKIMNADRMLYNFRRTFGQSTNGASALSGWDEPSGLLRGHSTGHFMSALAEAYASTGDQDYKDKLDYMIDSMRELQLLSKGKASDFVTACTPNDAAQSKWSTDPNTWGVGFISAYSPDQFALLEQYTPYATIWAPYYTMHKLLAGFLDSYVYAGNETGLEIAKDLGLWVYDRLSACTPEQRTRMWAMYIAGEYGGMNEVLARLYEITGDERLLTASRMFDNTAFFDGLAENRDTIQTRHANQHIPQIVGAIHEYAATGDPYYYYVARNFWEMATARYAYSIGGVGTGESFKQPYRQGNNINGNSSRGENCETCAAYNMLKLTRDIYVYDPDNAAYMDYYERTVLNQIAASQSHNSTSSMHNGCTYMLPIDPGQRKTYDSDYGGFTCCNGTGMENHVIYQIAAYATTEDTLYVNLYMPSTANWEAKGVTVKQETQFPSEDSRLTVTGSGTFRMKIRVPYWATAGFTVKVNGETICTNPNPSSYVEIDRTWADGDVVDINMPYTLHLDKTPDTVGGSVVASLMYGPIVMVAKDNRSGYTAMNWYELSLNDTNLEQAVSIEEPAGTGSVPHFKVEGLDFFPMYDAYNYRYHAYVKLMDGESLLNPEYLQRAVDAVTGENALTEANFDGEDWTEFQTALAAAQDLLSRVPDVTQEQLYDAQVALEEAAAKAHEPTAAPGSGEWKLVDAIEPGVPYVIVANGRYAMNNTPVEGLRSYSGATETMGATEVTIEGDYITSEVTDGMQWTFTEVDFPNYDGEAAYYLNDFDGKFLRRGSMSRNCAALILDDAVTNTQRYYIWSAKAYDELDATYALYVNSERAYGTDYAGFIFGGEVDGKTGFDIPSGVSQRTDADPFAFMNHENCAHIRFYAKAEGLPNIDFTNPEDASKFEIGNNTGSIGIVEGTGLTLTSTRPAFETCNGQNSGDQATIPEEVVKVPVAGDWTATLTVEFDGSGASNGYYQFFGFYAAASDEYATTDLAGIRGGDGAMQNFTRLNGTIDADNNNSAPGFDTTGKTYYLRLQKDGTTYICSRSDDGETFTEMFRYENTGIEAAYILIDAYTGMTTGYKFILKSLVFEGGEAPVIPVQLDKTALEAAIAAAEAVNADDYTDESVAALNEALSAANDALANAKTQDELDAAAQALNDAVAALEPKPVELGDEHKITAPHVVKAPAKANANAKVNIVADPLIETIAVVAGDKDIDVVKTDAGFSFTMPDADVIVHTFYSADSIPALQDVRVQGNPILPIHDFNPDTEPHVWEDPDNPGQYRFYFLSSHDLNKTSYCSNNHVLYSCPVDDLFNWTYHGVIVGPDNTEHNDTLYAPDMCCVEDSTSPTGKYYYYYPCNQAGGRQTMVLRSSRPDGKGDPFTVINWADESHSRTAGSIMTFDPSVFVDDDGKVYGYWGGYNSSCHAAQLDETMYNAVPGTQVDDIFEGDDVTGPNFGFFEASSMRKIGDTYVFVYSSRGKEGDPYRNNYNHLAYATSKSPLGPFTYGGVIVDAQTWGFYGGGNTHGGLVQLGDQWYITYHRNVETYARQAMISPVDVTIGEDGSIHISEAEVTSEGLYINGLNPYAKVSLATASYTKNLAIRPLYEEDVETLPIINLRSNTVFGVTYFDFNTEAPKGASSSLNVTLLPNGGSATMNIWVQSADVPDSQKKNFNTANATKIGEIQITADMPKELTTLSVDTPYVDQLDGKYGVYYTFTDVSGNNFAEFYDMQFEFSDHEHDYEDTVTPPTCTEQGYTTSLCKICGKSTVRDYTEALGHDWDEGVVTVEPTDDTPGVMTYTCRRCQETKTSRIKPLLSTLPDDIDFTNPEDREKFEIDNPGTAAIEEGVGLALICTTTAFEDCKEQLSGDQATTPSDVIVVPVNDDWTATLEVEFNTNGASNGYYQFFGFYAAMGDDYQNLVGIRGGDGAMQNFERHDGVITHQDEDGVNSTPGFDTNKVYWLRITKEGDTYTCYRGDDNGTTFTEMFSYTGTGIEADYIVIDAYTGMTQNYKFTLKSLTFLEPGETPKPPIDLTALEAAIAEAGKLNKDDYTAESWAALETALAAAEAAKTAETQAEVDAAKDALLDAISKLEKKPGDEKPDLTALEAAIAEAEALKKDEYTEESWAALEEALAAAKDALNADTQAAVDAAKDALLEAISKLEKKPIEEPFRFDDVTNPDNYFYDAVYWAYNHEPQITKGTTETLFGPNEPCTRGHVVTFLWRAANEPAPESENNPFTDLDQSRFYYTAVLWAVEKNITNGMTPTTFEPNTTCTRGQIVTFLWRFAGEPEAESDNNPFTDVNADRFYYNAVLWAVEQGITNGMTPTTFDPERICTRGQVVTFLYRAMAEKE